jgi:8-oxo-dGTP diphosphatase
MRARIAELVRTIQPFDDIEQEHLATTFLWIESGAPLCRTAKPATPPQHLVSYFVVVDPEEHALLLIDHRQSDLWLPNGGHVEPDEHPEATVVREAREELGLQAEFLFPEPLFLTVTQTVGQTAGHTDVSLWYVVCGSIRQVFQYDQSEFSQAVWFSLGALPTEHTDPHLGRFAAKLCHFLNDST